MKKSKRHNELSVILPAYKQEKTIIQDLEQLNNSLAKLKIQYEIILIVDGRLLDNTYDLARKYKKQHINIFGYPNNLGKGYAVRYGVLKATGDVIGFIDAGMDIDPDCIGILLRYMQKKKADIVIGSKLHPDSKVYYPYFRIIMSWGYRIFTHLLFGFGVKDTQVGLKLFKKKVAKDVFSLVLVKRFAFDVELLAVAYALGYKKIYEAPIVLNYAWNSSIVSKGFWKVILWMLWDTIAVFYRLKIIRYYDKKTLHK